jgi:dipeptidyl-peptidase-4
MTHPAGDSFPRQNARTQRFSLGRPRSFSVSEDGRTVVFVRSASGSDRTGRLWRWTAAGGEVELVDPGHLLAGDHEELSAEERARRERAREAASGIVAYTVDRAFARAVFSLSGRLFVTDIADGSTRELPTGSPVLDPRIDPTGQRLAYVAGGRLYVTELADGSARAVTPEETSDTVTWGMADFVAAEELDRSRGFWWAPDGSRLLVQRTDEAQVTTWYVSNPADPTTPAVPHRYPSAGSPNAEVSLWIVPLEGEPVAVDLPDGAEYIATAHWGEGGLPVVSVLDRPQQRMTWLAVFPDDGSTRAVRTVTDPTWVDVVPGSGCWDADGRLLTVEVRDGDYALCSDGERRSPAGLQVRAILDVGDDVLVQASSDPGDQQVWRLSSTGDENLTPTSGWHLATRGGATLVTVAATMDAALPVTTIVDGETQHEVQSFAEVPLLEPRVTVLPRQQDQPRVAVVLPTGWQPGSGKLPVLMDPYGGPHFASVMHHQGAFRESQWFADQGFAVVVVDGRGTPGHPVWERAVRYDVASVVLEDQVTGLHAAAHAFLDLDLDRVAIRGWSFGGYLAAMAVIDRPEVFHAAVSGAPVTHRRL